MEDHSSADSSPKVWVVNETFPFRAYVDPFDAWRWLYTLDFLFFFSVLTFVLVYSLPLPLGAGSFGIKIRVEEGQNFFFVFCERWGREWMEIYSWTPFSFWILTTSREIFLRFRFCFFLFFLFRVTKRGGILTNERRHWIGLVARLECGWEGDYRSLSLVSLTYRDRYDLYDSKRGIS